MKILSLFDGAACAHAALKLAKIPVTAYHAVELASARAARAIADSNHKISRPCDDVRLFDKSHAKALGKIDIIIAGFPCQSFSSNGLQKGLDDPRGDLIHDTMRVISLVKPAFFLLENTPPSNAHAADLNRIIGAAPIIANSANYGAQHRARAFWSNAVIAPKATPSPLFVKDIALPHNSPAARKQPRLRFSPCRRGNVVKIIGNAHPERKQVGVRPMQGYRVIDPRSKFPALRCHYGELLPISDAAAKPPRLHQDYCVISPDSKFPALRCKPGDLVPTSPRLARRLTPVEFCRLQNLPDAYTAAATPAGARNAIGNGMDALLMADLLSQILLNKRRALL